MPNRYRVYKQHKSEEYLSHESFCQQITQRGRRCRRLAHWVVFGSSYCYQHFNRYDPKTRDVPRNIFLKDLLQQSQDKKE